MSERTSLSVIVPAYNEAARIVPGLERISEYCIGRFDPFEIIVVDDGSSDDTADIVASLQHRMPQVRLLRLRRNQGKGVSVRAGMLSASPASDYLLMCDADLSTAIEEIEKLIPWVVSGGVDVAFGSRALRESRISVRQPVYREAMGKIFGFLAGMFVVPGIRDPQCGFKLFSGQSAREIFQRTRINRFAFDVEALFLARKFGYSIKEVAVSWSNSPFSRVRILRDSLIMAGDIFRIRYYALTKQYEKPYRG